MSTTRTISTLEAKKTINIQQRLQASLDFVRHLCVLGSSNKVEDIERTSGWVSTLKYRYSPGSYMKYINDSLLGIDFIANLRFSLEERELIFNLEEKTPKEKIRSWYYHVNEYEKVNDLMQHDLYPKTGLDPINDPRFKLNDEKRNLLRQALKVIEGRFGKCESKSALVSKYLWENHSGIFRIEALSMDSFDHVLIVVNREGKLGDSDTWGNAWIIDAWYENGVVFPASEFKERIKAIKKYAEFQSKELENMGLEHVDCINKDAALIKKVLWDIKPNRDCYPSYQDNMHFEDYYTYMHLPEKIQNNYIVKNLRLV